MSRVRFDMSAARLDEVSLGAVGRSDSGAPVLVKTRMLEGKQ